MKRLLLVVLTLGFMFGAVTDIFAEDNGDLKKALSHYHRGKFKEAVKYLEEYVDQKPNAAGYYMLGYALYKLKRFDEAEDYFRQAYLIDPNFSPEYDGLPQRPARKKAPKPETEAASPSGIKETPTPAAAAVKTEPKAAERPAAPAVSQKSEPQKAAEAEPVPPTAAPAKPATAPASPPGSTAAPAAPPAPQQATPPPAGQPKPSLPSMPPKGKQLPMPLPGMGVGLVGGILAGLGIFFLVIALAVYLFSAFCLYRIASRLSVPAAWTAWIPILQLWAIVGSAGKPWWWILLLFVPLVNIFVAIYIWLCITENLGHNKWLGLLMLLPVINLIFMAYLAFAKSPASAPPAGVSPEEDLT